MIFLKRVWKNLEAILSLTPSFAVGRSCTGTLIVSIEDVNDNAPTIPQDYIIICKSKMEYADILAADPDDAVNGAPFYFSLENASPDISRIWSLNRVNGI